MAKARNDSFSHFKIVQKGAFDLIAKVNDRFIASLADNTNPVISEINVLDIESHALRNADPGPEQKSNESNITLPCLVIVSQGFAGEGLTAVLNIIEKDGYLVGVQSNKGLVLIIWLRKRYP